MPRKSISILLLFLAVILPSATTGCATAYSLSDPDNNPNRIFSGTRISAANDPSSLVGDVVVLPITLTQTLINLLTGKFDEYERKREEAYARFEAERSRLPALSAEVAPFVSDPSTGAYTAFTIKLNREVYAFVLVNFTLVRNGVDVPLSNVDLQRWSDSPTSEVLTLPLALTTPKGKYLLTFKADGIMDRYSLKLPADASFSWSR